MDRLNISSLFRSEDGVRMLLHAGESFGITLLNEKKQVIIGNVIDFGLIDRESLGYNVEIPLGYDQYIDHNIKRIAKYSCSLINDIQSKQIFHQLPMFTLQKSEFFPQNNISDSLKPFIEFSHVKLSPEAPNSVTLCPGIASNFQVTISLDDRFEGSIGRWILLEFKAVQFPSPISLVETTFVMAIQIKGSVISEKSRRLLSSEALSFVPQYLANYFDLALNVYHTNMLTETRKRALTLTPPTIFQAVMAVANVCAVPSTLLTQSFNDFSISKTLSNFIKVYLHLSPPQPGPYYASMEYLTILLALNCAEELQMVKDIKNYDKYYQSLYFTPLNKDYAGLNDGVVKSKFTVVGLSESRPKISIGDIIRIRPAEEDIYALSQDDLIPRHLSELHGIVTSCSLKTEEVECQFLIHRAMFRDKSQATDHLPMIQVLNECNKVRYHIRFSFKREGFAFINDAINTIMKDESYQEALFPDADLDAKMNVRLPMDLSSVNLMSEFGFIWNNEQLVAIEAISSHLWKVLDIVNKGVKTPTTKTKLYTSQGTRVIETKNVIRRIPPFVLHGPPGTGKTTTVIESIRRLKEIHPTKRILVCAPSDAAADVLCSRLRKYFSQKQLLRLNWWQRLVDSVQPQDLISYCLTDSRGIFDMPPTAALMSGKKLKILSYDIVVCTCVCAGVLKHYWDASGSLLFDLVIVDEAGQASEGEIMVPFSMCSPSGVMVLAGDPKQLGPEMRCPLYRIPEYSLSLLERLMSLPFYKRCTKLFPNASPRDRPATSTPRENSDNISYRTSFETPPFPTNEPVHDIISDIQGLSIRQSPLSFIHPHEISSILDDDRDFPTPRDSRILSFNRPNNGLASPITPGTSSSGHSSVRSTKSHASTINDNRQRSLLSLEHPINYPGRNSPLDNDLTHSGGEFGELSSYSGVFLKKNYRSHHHMIQIPNKLFYNSSVEAFADTSKVSKYLSWSWLPSYSSCPMLFIGVDGQHFHALDSPSFFNVNEASKVVEVIASLLSEKDLGLNVNNIGVIGGFRSQVLKIRQMLRSQGLSAINVGGVEDYQGQEKEVVIISTVLTNRVLAYDRNGAIGLIGDDRRFNVAVTRGIGLCIVIGHPIYLYSDRNWKEYMEYCDQNRSFIGSPCPLLSRLTRESDDNDQLLNIAAQTALGGGYDDLDTVDAAYDYSNNRDSYWRVNL